MSFRFEEFPSQSMLRRSVAHENPSAPEAPPTKKENPAVNLSEAQFKGPYRGRELHFGGDKFYSVFEAVVGKLLERHVPGFAIREGHSYQAPLHPKSKVDFVVTTPEGGLLVIECHPFRVRQRMSRQDHKDWRNELNTFDSDERADFVDLTTRALIDNYYRERLALLRQDHRLSKAQLVIVTSAEDLYRHVLPKLGANLEINVREFSLSATKLKNHIKRTAQLHPARHEVDLNLHKNHFRGRRRSG